jgi:hypothetical protein
MIGIAAVVTARPIIENSWPWCEGGAVADDDHKHASAQCLRDILTICGRWTRHSDGDHGGQTAGESECGNNSSR